MSDKRLDIFLHRLSAIYPSYCHDVIRINQLLEDRGEIIHNDHIALRTLSMGGVNLECFAKIFKKFGYEEKGQYRFDEKKLNAKHYEKEGAPKIFISELQLDECSEYLRSYIRNHFKGYQASQKLMKGIDDRFDTFVEFNDYNKIKEESEYASWVLMCGFVPNHFTIDVNELETFETLESLNTFLKDNGVILNSSGGEIKGSPEELLEQSSTIASKSMYIFGNHFADVPGCYYEFAKRYPKEDGEMFNGFIAKSADKIFESTNER